MPLLDSGLLQHFLSYDLFPLIKFKVYLTFESGFRYHQTYCLYWDSKGNPLLDSYEVMIQILRKVGEPPRSIFPLYRTPGENTNICFDKTVILRYSSFAKMDALSISISTKSNKKENIMLIQRIKKYIISPFIIGIGILFSTAWAKMGPLKLPPPYIS